MVDEIKMVTEVTFKIKLGTSDNENDDLSVDFMLEE